MADDHSIEVRSLTKTYKKGVRALNGVEFFAKRSTVVALLGLNGAGKSTLINILAGVIPPTAGCASVCGFDVVRHPLRARRAIGVVHQEIANDVFSTVREALDFQAGLYGIRPRDRINAQLLDLLSLSDVQDKLVRKLSGGMKRRLMIAKALVHRPPVVVLDEPTAGVDPSLRANIWEIIRQLRAAGVTVVLTTHYLAEAEALCDEVSVLHKGEIIADDSLTSLLGGARCRSISITTGSPIGMFNPPAGVKSVRLEGPCSIWLKFDTNEVDIGCILKSFCRAGYDVIDVSSKEASLEDAFVEITRGP